MIKKFIIISIGLFFIIALFSIILLVINQINSSPLNINTNSDVPMNDKDDTPISYTDNDSITYFQEDLKTYTHPSGKFSYNYPDIWEFVPKREDMGLRPKAYGGFSKNEIVTILYFPDKGSDLKKQAMEYDGAASEEWISVDISSEYETILYKHQSNNLEYYSYWNGNGKDAVKVMFRKFNSYSVDGHTDNSSYLEDFNTILNSFKFI